MMTAMTIAMLTAIAAWWLLVQRLKEKPWLEQGELPTSSQELPSAPRVGLWVFLAVVSSLFGLFASAYMMRLGHSGGLTAWQRLDEPGILWLNTLVLLFASGAMQIARTRGESGDERGLRAHFTGAGLLTIVFLVGQAFAWRMVADTQAGPGNPAFSFFVLLTAAHGLHLVGGLVVLARTSSALWRGVGDDAAALERVRTSVQLCTIYWHWLLLIWLGVFALLLTT
jgi:cytochrome c oxidase subunit 3